MAFFGFIKRKERWSLTATGWIALIVVVAAVLVAAVLTVHPFLAVNDPVEGEILVVEGWLPDYAMEGAIQQFRSRDYRLLVTTGGPLCKGHYLMEYKTSAELSAAVLKQMGLDENQVKALPTPVVSMNRTYASALALKEWLDNSRPAIKAVDVFSQGPHARRTRLLFEKALGDEIRVGIIAAPDEDYDPRRWWMTSDGFRTVIDETIAYLYARFLFYPQCPDLLGAQRAERRGQSEKRKAQSEKSVAR